VTIILASAADNVSLTTAGAAPIDVTASWVDQGPGSPLAPILPSGQNTLFTSATTQVICPGPAVAKTVRNLKTLTIVNKDPVNSNTIVVTRTLSGVTATMTPGLGGTFVLQPGFVLEWRDGDGWRLIDQSGSSVVERLAISAAGSSVVTGTVVFSNFNNVSFGMVGSTITASAIAGAAGINFSAGTTSNNLTAITFANSNGISFGLDDSTVTASIATSLSNINISAGTTSNNLSAVTFANGNGVSFGIDGSTVTASVATSLSNINVSAGTTSNDLSAVTFANANGVAFGLNGSVVTASVAASAAQATIRVFSQDADFVTNFPIAQNALSIQKVSMPMNLLATQLAVVGMLSGPSASSGALTLSHAIYTLSNGTASLASSASRAFSWAAGTVTSATSVYGGASGTRYRTLPVDYAMTPGDYLFAWVVSTSNGAAFNLFGRAAFNLVGTFDGFETSQFLNGSSVSTVGGFPTSIAATDPGYARTGFSAVLQPGAILAGT
jgi:hypothetical protein